MPDISRRAVLGGAAGATALAAMGVESAQASTAPAPARAHYARSVGKAFTAVAGGRSHRVTLSAIGDAVPTRAQDRPFVFTLIFTPADGTQLAEGIYSIRRWGVFTHSLLLSPVGTAGQLQAAVNRARP